MRGFLCAATLAVCVLSEHRALADGSQRDGADALPGIVRVPLAVPTRSLVGLGASMGYGLTESVLRANDLHHRLGVQVAASVRPIPWLAVGMRVAWRYDAHAGSTGSDDGSLFDGHVTLRGVIPVTPSIGLGLSSNLWIPSQPVFSLLPLGLSFDNAALLSIAPPRGRLTFTFMGGFRLDRSALAFADAGQWSPADRLASGASAYHAGLVGLALTAALTPTIDLLAEWDWAPLIGSRADAFESPMHLRAGLGIRTSMSSPVRMLLALEAHVGGRAPRPTDVPLVPNDPRFGLVFGVQWQSGAVYHPARETASDTESARRRGRVAPARGGSSANARAGTHGVVEGVIRQPSGGVLAGVSVQLVGESGSQETTTDDQGRYRFDRVPPGDYHVRAQLYGRQDVDQGVRVDGGRTATRDAVMQPGSAQAQIRGTVRSITGEPVAATVSTEIRGRRRAVSATGEFSIDVPPGRYSVLVSAPGYDPQRRSVTVESNGVTILNVDLRRSR